MRLISLAAFFCIGHLGTAAAGVEEAVEEHAIPATRVFAKAAEHLSASADANCMRAALRPAWNAAFDAWLGLSHLRFGPLEEESRALTIAFWPDTRGMVPRAVRGMVSEAPQMVSDPETFGEISVAARGLYGMERLLYADEFEGYGTVSFECTFVRAQARDLARLGAEIESAWSDFQETIRTAGAPGNDTFLSEREPRQAFYTALTTGLQTVAEQRLGRPLGTFDDPRPGRAEAKLSARSLRNVTLSLAALDDLARHLADGPIPKTEAAFDRAAEAAGRVESPDLSGVSDPATRVRIEALQQRVEDVRAAVAQEIGAALGVSAGFNSADGD